MHTMPAPTSRYARFLRPGAIMMALGALLLLAGVVQTTSSTNGGNQSCPSGTSLIAKFEYGSHSYHFDSPSGNEHVVTLSHESADGAWWASTKPISAIIVKGGPASVLYSIAPPQVTGSFSNSGLPPVGHGNTPDISNVQFCGSNIPVTTTTSASTTSSSSTSSSTSTSTTSASTTTTCGQCQTTTTAAPTTTSTCGECQTTTTHTSSTTCQCSTTTEHVPPTSCHCSTTTHPQETTTTLPQEETTSTVSGSTTTSSDVSGSTLRVTTTTRVHAGTTVHGQGTSTSFGPTVSSTSVFTGDGGTTLPFTGSSSTPLMVIGLVLLATGLTLTLSQARRRGRTTS
jgi:hypothetical protein